MSLIQRKAASYCGLLHDLQLHVLYLCIVRLYVLYVLYDFQLYCMIVCDMYLLFGSSTVGAQSSVLELSSRLFKFELEL